MASGAGEQAAKVISQSFVLQVSEPCGTGGPEAFTEVAAANVDCLLYTSDAADDPRVV